MDPFVKLDVFAALKCERTFGDGGEFVRRRFFDPAENVRRDQILQGLGHFAKLCYRLFK
jgi:hypothetical protein